MRISRWQRIAAMALAVLDLMIFSHLTILPMIAILIGAVVIFLGIEYSYRPASIVGMLVVAIAASASISIPSLLTLSNLLTAMVGLLLPLLILIWLALSTEEGEAQEVTVVRNAALVSVGYALVCIWSAPIAILVVSLFSPTLAMNVSILVEISILLVITVAGGVLMMRRTPRTITPAEPESASNV